MQKSNRDNLMDIWKMRHLTVKEFFVEISVHSDLKFLITVVGFWWMTRLIAAITIGVNVIYYLFRIFQLGLG